MSGHLLVFTIIWDNSLILYIDNTFVLHLNCILTVVLPGLIKAENKDLFWFPLQEISTWTPDRACPWWVLQDIPTCPPWAAQDPQWQVTWSHREEKHDKRITYSHSDTSYQLFINESDSDFFPLQDTMHRWTSSTWYLPETSRCIACQLMTSRMTLIGTPLSSPSRPPFAKKKGARRGGGSQRKPGWAERPQEEEEEAEEEVEVEEEEEEEAAVSGMQKNIWQALEKDKLQSPDIFTKAKHN